MIMHRSLSSSITLTLLTFTLTVLFSLSLSPSVLAQDFVPSPVSNPCVAFAEGQGLYVLGGYVEGGKNIAPVPQSFMLDLSVSWNTTDPVYKEMSGPLADLGACTMTNRGEDLFILQKGTGYVYNVKSEKWRTVHNTNFTSGNCPIAASDPETGYIYLPDCGMSFQGKVMMLSLDLKTDTVNTTVIDFGWGPAQYPSWNAHLKSMVLTYSDGELLLFTPSNVNSTSEGWRKMKTGPLPGLSPTINCVVPAYGDSKLILHGVVDNPEVTGFVYTYDVIKGTWTKGLPAPAYLGSACAVTGDQLILWGGYPDRRWLKNTNRAFVYNMKSEEWVPTFIAPPPRSTPPSQPSQTPNQDTSLSSSKDKYLVIIIAVVSASLVSITIGFIIGYFRRGKNNKDGHAGDPTPLGRIHKGSFGALPDSGPEHPHAIVKDSMTTLSVQQDTLGVGPLQHPHSIVREEFAPAYNDKEEYTGEYDGRARHEK